MQLRKVRQAVALCAFAVVSNAWAHQPTPVNIQIDSVVARRGESYLRVTNNTRDAQAISFSPGPASTVTFRTTRAVLVPGGSSVNVGLGDLQLTDGNQVLNVSSTVFIPEADSKEGPQLYEVLVVDATGVTKSTYEKVFLSQRREVPGRSKPAAVDIGGGYIDMTPMARLAFASVEVGVDAKIEDAEEIGTYEMSRLPLRSLPEAGGLEGPAFGVMPVRQARSTGDNEERQAGLFGSISGKFVLKLPNNVWKSAWGWKVRAWQCLAGECIPLGSTSTSGTGKWTIEYIMTPLPGIPVRIEYQPANRFIKLQDIDGNVYSWGENWNVTAKDMNVGTRSANLSKNGDAPGIDVIFQGGMAVWRKFHKYNMSALRDEPVEVSYPNSLASGNCTNSLSGPTIAWSCSDSGSGKIWLIPEHAKARVIQHELGHSIHSYYWDGSMPSGSGGDHDGSKCYNGGLALSEGFATFLSYWTQFDRTAVNPQVDGVGMKIENPGANVCQSSTNESWVAATFWDTYDTTNEGVAPKADTWSFYHAYAPVSTFLNNPGHDSMPEYLFVYNIILGPQSLPGIVQLFTLNHMN